MANHRSDRRGPRRSPSVTRQDKYVGRRVAGRETFAPATSSSNASESDLGLVLQVATPLDHTSYPQFGDTEATATLPLVKAEAGRRKAVKHVGQRGPLFRVLPSVPVLVGVTALAVSIGGAVTAANTTLAGAEPTRLAQASALTGATSVARVNLNDRRDNAISRDSRRDALAEAADAETQQAVEQQFRQYAGAQAKLAQKAGNYAKVIEQNRWVLPLASYRITATFGQSGLWASTHTGLDFATPSGTPIVSVANGTVTETGSAGAYGNRTIVTLEDGTEIWYCHQTSINVSTGDSVRAGEQIGTVGTTGNVTGPHLHLEVRPGGGDPVDPYSALQVNGVTP